MTTGLMAELEKFHKFIGEKLSNGAADMTPEEALDEWRALHPTAEELAESVAAIKEALADMEAGDTGISLEEFDRQFREKHIAFSGRVADGPIALSLQ